MPKFPHDRLSERVYQYLRDQILNLEIPLGARLMEQEIARDLDVSSTPVKQALARLTHEQLVETVPRRGKYVKLPCEKEIRDVYEVRRALEMLAVEKATGLIDRYELEDFRRRLEEAEKAAGTGDCQLAFDLDGQLHERIVQVHSNDLLQSFMGIIKNRIQLFRRIGSTASGTTINLRSLARHRAIVEAMLAGDGKRAASLMGRHIDETEEQALRDAETFLRKRSENQ